MLKNLDDLLLLTDGFLFLRLTQRFGCLKVFLSRNLFLIEFGVVFLGLEKKSFLPSGAEFPLQNNDSFFKCERLFRLENLDNFLFLLAYLRF